MRANQVFSPAQVYSPGATVAQTDIGSIINQILPLMVLAMVFAMVVPMFKGVTRGMGA